MLKTRLDKLIIVLFMCWLPLLGGWSYNESVESVMRDYGFQLRKREVIQLQSSSQSGIRYVFTHKLYKTVIVNEYSNGLIEIGTYYKGRKGEEPKWEANILQVVPRQELRKTVYTFFSKGGY
jgi:hypothetical protein